MRLGLRSGLRVELAQDLGQRAIGAGDDGLALRHDPAMDNGARVRVRTWRESSVVWPCRLVALTKATLITMARLQICVCPCSISASTRCSQSRQTHLVRGRVRGRGRGRVRVRMSGFGFGLGCQGVRVRVSGCQG